MPQPVQYRLYEEGDNAREGWRDLLVKGWITNGPEGEVTILAARGNVLIAMVGFIRTLGQVEVRDYVSLEPDQGAGLFDRLETYGVSIGINYVWLYCRNDPDRPAENMQSHFESHGFTFRERYDTGWIVMEKSI